MKSTLLLCLLISAKSAADKHSSSSIVNRKRNNGNHQAAGLRGLKDRQAHTHKGPKPAKLRNNNEEPLSPNFRGGNSQQQPETAEPAASDTEEVVETVEQLGAMKVKQARMKEDVETVEQLGAMKVKQAKMKMERANKKQAGPKGGRFASTPAPAPDTEMSMMAHSYSYEEPAKYLGLDEEDNKHDFRMEVKLAKKQGGRKGAPVPSPVEDNNLPPAPATASMTDPEEESSGTTVTTTTTQKGLTKKERKKAAKMNANKGLLKGAGGDITGVLSSTEDETAASDVSDGMGRMVPKKTSEKRKRGSFAAVEGEEGGADGTSDGMDVDSKPTKKNKAERKHKKEKKGSVAPEIENTPAVEPQQEEQQGAATAPADELASKGSWPPAPVPSATPVETSAPTPVPTPAPVTPVTPEPTTQEPTTLPPVAAIPVAPPAVVEPPANTDTGPPAFPTCPPAWDRTRNNSNNPYVAGETSEVQSHIFECHALYVEYCNVAEWDDSLLESNPNAEEMWNLAWTHLGPCA